MIPTGRLRDLNTQAQRPRPLDKIALAMGGTVLLPLESNVLWECPSRSQCYFVEQLMSQISLLVSQSVENLKCSHTEAAMDQLREIKMMKQEEPKSFNRKGNEFQYNPGLLGRL